MLVTLCARRLHRSRHLLVVLSAALALAIGLVALTGPAPAHARVRHQKTTVRPTDAIRKGTGAMRARTTGRFGNLGVATFNVLGTNPAWEQRADVRRITRDRRVQVVGFQEATALGRALRSLPAGWAAWQSRVLNNGREVAIAWRTDRLSLVSVAVHKAHPRLGDITHHPGRLARPFPGRFTTEAVFTDRRSGSRLTLLDVHANQYTESFQEGRPGVPRANSNARQARVHIRQVAGLVARARARSRYVVVVGDFNWDFVADRRRWADGFVLDTLGPIAVSSFQSLGIRNLAKTHPETRPLHRLRDARAPLQGGLPVPQRPERLPLRPPAAAGHDRPQLRTRLA